MCIRDRLRRCAGLAAYYDGDYNGIYNQAATALSTLQAENEKLRAELEQVKQERDVAIKEIFQWTGCPACKHWDSADNWCNKHDRSADSCDGCSTPEWHGLEKA